MSIPQPLKIWPNHDQIVSAYYQLSDDELTKKQSKTNKEQSVNGALVVKQENLQVFSKRSVFVNDEMTSQRIWWGDINIPFSIQDFNSLYEKIMVFLDKKILYARDVFAGADKRYRIDIRIFNETPWANLFVHNMFIQPDAKELKKFQHDWLLLNIPSFMADPKIDRTRQSNFTIINFSKKVILIGGSGYTGEIKKSIFSVLITPPQQKMYCPCTALLMWTLMELLLYFLGSLELEKQPFPQMRNVN